MQKAKWIAVLGMALAIVVLVPASHASSLTYTPTPVGVGQTSNNPCVIGDPSCDASVTASLQLNYTSNSGPCAGGLCDFTSPVYVAGTATLAPLTIPLTFTIGVDENLATGQGPELLQSFTLFSCTGTTAATCLVPLDSTTGVNTLVNENNGNGHTDGILTGFSTLTPGTHYMFEANWSNDTDGMEQFWIIPGTATITPEPGTIALLGMGVVGLLGLGLRRKQV
jgi:PEP-CTERM motif